VLDYSAAGVRASVEESLARLGLDRVDILYVHDPELSGIPGATESALEALAELRDEGIVAAAVFNSGLDHGVDLPPPRVPPSGEGGTPVNQDVVIA
jgi:aryl-alcohol dehydrogenase-like predicted oxidoreductase